MKLQLNGEQALAAAIENITNFLNVNILRTIYFKWSYQIKTKQSENILTDIIISEEMMFGWTTIIKYLKK